MARKIVWLLAAVDDLGEIATFIDSRGSAFSGIVVARILQTVEPLADFPLTGPVIREDDSGRHRHLICYSYRIIYRPEVTTFSLSASFTAHENCPPTCWSVCRPDVTEFESMMQLARSIPFPSRVVP